MVLRPKSPKNYHIVTYHAFWVEFIVTYDGIYPKAVSHNNRLLYQFIVHINLKHDFTVLNV